ncbi:MAG: cytochrome c oxidase assembly protein [Spirochaetaceae bacterium]|nr:cytochrome c oxidase assembly protein [Spirochaetaceae bacterium]
MKRLLPIVAAAAVLAAGGAAFLTVRTPSPEQVATRLLHARYVNDAAVVYELASAEDRRWRTLEQHLAGHPQFPAEFQELIVELGEFIEIRETDSDLQGDAGVVTAHGTVPNANHPELRGLLYGEGAAAGSTVEERRAELRRRGEAGALPVIEFSQRVELVREGEHWKVFLDWAVGFTIRFRAEVREELPFEFSVEPESIMLKPGETGAAVFRARNLSEGTVKAKAGHLFEPPVAFLHTELLQCFCFFEDTYAPGEERELPVAIRLGWDIPPDIGEIAMVYEYYPLAQFQDRRPAEARDD